MLFLLLDMDRFGLFSIAIPSCSKSNTISSRKKGRRKRSRRSSCGNRTDDDVDDGDDDDDNEVGGDDDDDQDDVGNNTRSVREQPLGSRSHFAFSTLPTLKIMPLRACFMPSASWCSKLLCPDSPGRFCIPVDVLLQEGPEVVG